MQHAARTELCAEVREVLRRRVVAQFRLLLGIEVIEIAEELIEAVHRRQVLVPVAQMVFPELGGGIPERFQHLGDGGILGLHSRGGARQPDLAQASAEDTLAHDERRPSGGATLLGIVVSEEHALIGHPVNVRCLVSHHAFRVGAEVRLADVIAPEDDDVGLLVCGDRGKRAGNQRDRPHEDRPLKQTTHNFSSFICACIFLDATHVQPS